MSKTYVNTPRKFNRSINMQTTEQWERYNNRLKEEREKQLEKEVERDRQNSYSSGLMVFAVSLLFVVVIGLVFQLANVLFR